MKESRSIQFLLVLMVGILPARLSAQASVPPEKFVFVQPIGSAPPGANAKEFSVPSGVAFGASATAGSVSGTILVADPQNNRIVAFPPAGPPSAVSAFSCPSHPGCLFGFWKLVNPTYVAFALNGDAWISDTGNDVVVEVNTAGAVVRFAGAGPQPVCVGSGCPSSHPNAGQDNGKFFGPGPIAVDAVGNLYVVDGAGGLLLDEAIPPPNLRIQKFASDGTFLTKWGSFCKLDASGMQAAGSPGNCNTSSPGAVALGDGQLTRVLGIAVDATPNVYIAEEGNNRVQKFDAGGTFLLKWGGLPVSTSVSSAVGDGKFNAPGGIAVDALDQSVYVVDRVNDRIQQFDASGNFLSKGGSNGVGEAQFNHPFGIATIPGSIALTCLLGGLADCTHGFVVSEFLLPSGNTRVQFLGARYDHDNDGITDDVDPDPNTFSNDFNNSSLGFTTHGSIVARGDQTFAIYGVLDPNPLDEIRIRTESFGGTNPLQLTLCGLPLTLSFPAGTGGNVHCSTPTVVTEEGPVGFRFVGGDGTIATATLNTGDSLSVDVIASQIISNAGTIVVVVGGKSVSLSPGQSTFVDSTPPTTTATVSPVPNAAGWNNSNVTVNLASIDNPGGSGVKQITYSASGAQTVASTVVSGGSTTFVISAEGITTITFFGTDNAGNIEAAKTITIKLDKTPPTVVCSASPNVLWPPNNKLVPINVSVNVTDSLSGPAGFDLISVTSNEPDSGHGDIQGFVSGSASASGQLRAQRSGSGTGRVYTFTYSGADHAGNTASCTTTVSVPHDQGH